MLLLLSLLFIEPILCERLRFDNVTYSFRVPQKWGILSLEDAHCCPRGKYLSLRTRTDIGLPTIIGLGVQKGGSTSLAQYLSRHSSYIGSRPKETHVFDKDNVSSIASYQRAWKRGHNSKKIRFEFTPSYLWIPFAACRIKKVFPNMKFMVILRDPVKRAYSEFNMVRSRCRRPGPVCAWKHSDFYVYVKKGVADLRARRCMFRSGDGNKNWNDCFQCLLFNNHARTPCQYRPYYLNYESGNTCFHFGAQFLTRGLYAAQLAWWFELFPPENFIIIHSEEFFKNSVAQLNMINAFLGVSKRFEGWMTKSQGMKGKYTFKDPHLPQAQDYLRKFYLRPNQELYRLLDELELGPFTPFESWWKRDEKYSVLGDEYEEGWRQSISSPPLQRNVFPKESMPLLPRAHLQPAMDTPSKQSAISDASSLSDEQQSDPAASTSTVSASPATKIQSIDGVTVVESVKVNTTREVDRKTTTEIVRTTRTIISGEDVAFHKMRRDRVTLSLPRFPRYLYYSVLTIILIIAVVWSISMTERR